MKLFEFEAGEIFKKAGIAVPFSVVISDKGELDQVLKRITFPLVAKVQTLSGKRGKRGGVQVCETEKEMADFVEKYLGKDIGGEEVSFIQLSQKVAVEKEFFVSLTFSTVERRPVLILSDSGGVDVEENKNFKQTVVDPLEGISNNFAVKAVKEAGLPEQVSDVVVRLWDAFVRYDCRLAEINPLAADAKGKLWALDAKIVLDDAALERHKDLHILPKGSLSAIPSEREKEAKLIDKEDYRGSAGSTYFDLDGDIAVLASGGGGSLVIMDALLAGGGKPANYTEYSGDPPAEKVAKLTKITLSKEGLKGCLVAGALANFTDIYETLRGFCDGLLEAKPRPSYPIVIRRAGVRDKEAFDYVKNFARENSFDIHLYDEGTTISEAAATMVGLAYK